MSTSKTCLSLLKYRLRFLSCVFIFHLFSLTSVIILSIAPVPNKTTSSAGYNRRQNELRHFPLKGLFDVFLTSKGENIAFPKPIHCMQCCAAVRATFRKQQTLHLCMEGRREGCGFFCSLRLPYLCTMPQQFCRRM